MDLREQLQSTLGTAYTLERELGGGGMSRVFVATETALGRTVVVKVLSPELAQGVSVERFRREIQLAAQLQHPHIVPVHTSGETGGLPFYTMPFVDGASLRSRLARAAALPVGEAISILREVAKALAYAHERGVVHRDIKPDNILLTGGSAVVTDFGIAKALSASRTTNPTETLTQIGTSIGTPTYMSPEQAAADPATNHRADIYSFGCLAYELLTGRPPFQEKTPQRLLAAHMGEKPEPVVNLRADTPPMLAELVTRCLEKDPDNRPQSAADLVKVLESVTTSGSAHPAMPAILLGGRPRLARALAAYAAAFAAVGIVAKAAVVGIGLPTWVLPATIIVMALGLPMILFTAFVHRGAHQAMTMAGLTPGGTPVVHSTLTRFAVKASPWVSWRRTTLGGVGALGALLLLIVGYMVSRAFGIGPAASLMGAGVLSGREKLIIADFKSPPADTTLGPVVTEAFRSDLAQSTSLDIVQPTSVRETLRRMQRPVDSRVDYALAREVATREGIKAVVDGEVLSLGGSFVIAAKLMSAQTGEVLATFRVTAEQSKDIIAAIDKLSRDVRTKVGESLKSINAAPELARVTTPSLDALKKYVQAVEVFRAGNDFGRGTALLDEAIALDTSFAMAYRKLATELGNHGGFDTRQIEMVSKAYAHRDRLSEPERYLTEGAYWRQGPNPDLQKQLVAYEALIELQPNNATALNNAALVYSETRQYAKAEGYAKRAVASNQVARPYFENLLAAQVSLGHLQDAAQSIDEFARRIPGSASAAGWRAALYSVADQFDSARAVEERVLASPSDRATRGAVLYALSNAAAAQGRIADAVRLRHESATVVREEGVANAPLVEAWSTAMLTAWFTGRTDRAQAILDSATRPAAMDKVAPIERPYDNLAWAYTLAGRPDRARAMLAAFDESRKVVKRDGDPEARHWIAGEIALSEKRYDEAVVELRASDTRGCEVCVLPDIARAYDLGGKSDSALAVFERFATNRHLSRDWADGYYLAGAYKRLGELYEAKGDRQKASTYYTKFLNLWNHADPELQPRVAEVRKRLAHLSDTEARRF